jgi:hypothetical protein
MKKISITMAALAITIAASIIACNSDQSPSQRNEGMKEQAVNDSLLKRGQYLVTIMGCNDCHSPKVMGPNGPEPDPAKLLSGHPSSLPVPKINAKELESWVLFNHTTTAFVGPWGVSYAANITGDETGIGNWTEEQFAKALKKGKSKGLDSARTLLPPMPWPNYSSISDEDLHAIYVFLKSVKVDNVVPAPITPTEISETN